MVVGVVGVEAVVVAVVVVVVVVRGGGVRSSSTTSTTTATTAFTAAVVVNCAYQYGNDCYMICSGFFPEVARALHLWKTVQRPDALFGVRLNAFQERTSAVGPVRQGYNRA